MREGGPSFWRRVRLIPFEHVVPEDQRVADLHEQLLDDEGPAILGWAVRGAVEVLADGLQDPDAVIKATRDYEISEDTLASFVRDECMLGSAFWCKVSDIRGRYETALRRNGCGSAKRQGGHHETHHGVPGHPEVGTPSSRSAPTSASHSKPTTKS